MKVWQRNVASEIYRGRILATEPKREIDESKHIRSSFDRSVDPTVYSCMRNAASDGCCFLVGALNRSSMYWVRWITKEVELVHRMEQCGSS